MRRNLSSQQHPPVLRLCPLGVFLAATSFLALSGPAYGQSGTIVTIAGNGSESGDSGDGGAATAAGIYYPNAIAVDAAGNIYITDQTQRIRPSPPKQATASYSSPWGWGRPVR